MVMAYMTWLVMYGNGAQTGIAKIIMKSHPTRTQQDQILEMGEFCEAILGIIILSTMEFVLLIVIILLLHYILMLGFVASNKYVNNFTIK